MLIRYPGGKGKLATRLIRIISRFLRDNPMSYREPFFGAGAIGFRLLRSRIEPRATFSDIDYGMISLWWAVKEQPDDLITLISDFKPNTESFFKFKKYLLNIPEDDYQQISKRAEIGFKKLAIHQMSFSGLGTKSGGPLGGVSQSSDYKIDCRWSPSHMKKNIFRLNELMKINDTRIEWCDFESIVTENGHKSFIYLDPPYYEKGPELYQYAFEDADHVRLSANLRQTSHVWLVSYDDNPRIRKLYDFADIVEVPLNYSVRGATSKTEILIAPKKYSRLLEEKQEISIF
jgi:DNA adenine methylase